MNSINKIEKDFYLEIKSSIDSYLKYFESHLKNPEVDPDRSDESINEAYRALHKKKFSEQEIEVIKKLIKGICLGVVHSLFVSIDGGTAISNEGSALELIDAKTQEPLTKGALHENFFEVILGDEKNSN